MVARRRRHRRQITACTYLVDAYCLGVKNATGPDEMDDRGLRSLTDFVFSAYAGPPVSAPIDLVRDLVLGAVEYAHGLGFAPHPDFEQARLHLGPWEGSSAITFGCDGQPLYISGPHHNPDHILRTLRRTVGDGGFRQIAQNQPDNRSTRFPSSSETGSASIRAIWFVFCFGGGTVASVVSRWSNPWGTRHRRLRWQGSFSLREPRAGGGRRDAA